MYTENLYIKKDIVKRYSDGGRYYPGGYKEEGLKAILDCRERFPVGLCLDFTFYQPRTEQRYLLFKNKLLKYVGREVLDVGSRDTSAEKALGRKVTLIDKNNTNLESWDWEKTAVPFPGDSFDTVICFDTLEHINDIHTSVADLFRVSKDTVIISLPNCWKKQIKKMMTLSPGQASYGIPPEKPMDRHKWFFNPEDVESFLSYAGATYKNPFEVVEVIHHAPKTRLWHKVFFPILVLFPSRIFKNYFVETIFVVLKKKIVS